MLREPAHGHEASRFTLQWHLTHACDLHCKHCYDRSKVSAFKLDQCTRVLDDMEAFCKERELTGSICFSGGNPFLYHSFFDVYAEAARRGFRVSILGNPVTEEQLDRLVAIRKPGYYQVSLEGLQPHNDHIRGEGFFEKVMAFLPMLRERKIQTVVMSTLTQDNMGQMIPLARQLHGKVDRFAYNRLAQVGEGANLAAVGEDSYAEFMIGWMKEAETNKSLVFKDNLFNIYRHELGQRLHGGCTGYGCGAAFNFFAVLPDGEVHACRKFPSPLGNITEQSLSELWEGQAARSYRQGCAECEGCAIRSRCGGCLAVAHGHGLDPLKDRDPHCFMMERPEDQPGFVSPARRHLATL